MQLPTGSASSAPADLSGRSDQSPQPSVPVEVFGASSWSRSGRCAQLLVCCVACCATLWLGIHLGRGDARSDLQSSQSLQSLPQLQAATAATGETMAMATGPISDDADGVFFLDFNTGDLQCMVYYPRAGAFGAHYYANVLGALGGGGKNSKYLMVTGQSATKGQSGRTRPAASLVYVTDVTNGTFAAYAVPWDTTAEMSGRGQSGPLVAVAGGSIRNYRLPDGNNKGPAGGVDPNKK